MPFGLAIVGVGDVAQRDYLPELARFAGLVEARVACGRTAERARDVARRFGIPRWTTSLDEAVAGPDVDAVVNLTPIPTHLEVTLTALGAGKHVFSEKPLAGSVSDADRIADAARERRCTVVSAPCVMLFPPVVHARRILESGALGAVHSVRAHAQGGVPPWAGYASDPTPFFAADAGPLVDMAVYPLHAITGLLGRVRRVAALSQRTRRSFVVEEGALAGTEVPLDADDNWHLLLELESGVLASVEANNCSDAAVAPELELRGERGALGVSLLDVSAPVVIATDGATEEEIVPHGRLSGPDHVLGIAHLAECVAAGTEPLIGIEPARHVLEVIEAARRSAAEGRLVEVGDRG